MNSQFYDKLKIGVSSCLLGTKVHFDAGNKKNIFVKDILGEYVDFVPVCLDLEAGFGAYGDK